MTVYRRIKCSTTVINVKQNRSVDGDRVVLSSRCTAVLAEQRRVVGPRAGPSLASCDVQLETSNPSLASRRASRDVCHAVLRQPKPNCLCYLTNRHGPKVHAQ